MSVIVSDRAAEASPTLMTWIAATGLACHVAPVTAPGRRGAPRILHVSEMAQATCADVLVEFRDGPPEFIWSAAGLPARIGFGFEDMAFGHAMVAELVRPAHRPASGEPESGRFLQMCERVAASDATVLVLGETGTGKEGVSRFVHETSSRADKPFVPVNCAALPSTMLEAILFGHQKGSFTGAGAAGEGLFRAADGGTLMLDEVSELPLDLQAKLLRALQEREVLPVGATRAIPVDARVIAAANRDLAGEVAAGRFRADLYWRLNVIPLAIKPLRERRQDVRAITAALLLKHAPKGAAFAWPTAAALDRLMAHGWPGNVRELENTLQRALLLRAGDRLEASDLSIEAMPMPRDENLLVAEYLPAEPQRLSAIGRASQARAIREALEATGGHRVRAAERLGISERTLRYRLAEFRAAA